ncbi:MAG TPA: beta-propeller fold lactonase family protein [Terriglobia bacterium]|nr:beta-propeller fold lactonase family protein [Terriglobia bacterium]
MLKNMRWSIWSFALLVVFSTVLNAQDFVYTNNDLAGANSVSAFSVAANGTLSPIAGSPFLTSGAGTGGGLYSANRIIVVNDFLYASNSASNTVSAFSIDPGSGYLTLVSGSPFSTGAFNDASRSGISLAATPDGKYLYAGSTGYDLNFNFGPITIYSIGASGALATVGSAAVGSAMSSMKVSPDGKFLVVALYQTGQIAVFAIQSDGTLQAVTGSPFTLTAGAATGVDINCGSNLLYAGGPTGNIYGFNFASNGQLTAVTGSPFASGASSNQVVALSTDDKTLFSSNQGDNSVTAFEVVSGGGLTVPGTSVNAAGTAGTDTLPTGLAVSKDGTFLFAADTYSAVSTFVLGGSSPLIFGSLTATASPLHSLAAYPAKACSTSGTDPAGLVANLQILAGPPPGFDLEATLVLDSGLVVDPLTQPVAIQIGTFVLNLPAGSFKVFQNGTHSSIYLFQGVINSITLKVQITPLGQNQFQISAIGKQIDLTSLVDQSVTVAVSIGGNSASTIDPPKKTGSTHGNWRNQ